MDLNGKPLVKGVFRLGFDGPGEKPDHRDVLRVVDTGERSIVISPPPTRWNIASERE